MTFAAENLNVTAYANGFTLWNYISEDNLSDICSKNYFAAADNDLKSGDMILVSLKSTSFSSGAILLVSRIEIGEVSVVKLCQSSGGF